MITGAVATLILMIAAASLLLQRGTSTDVSGAGLLQASVQAEQAAAQGPDRVLHRTVLLEERRGEHRTIVSRRRIETWQIPSTYRNARRIYNEKNELVAGDWAKQDGSRFVLRNAKVYGEACSNKAASRLDPLGIWQLSLSAAEFAALTERSNVTVEHHPETYVLRYANTRSTPKQRLLRASLTLRRSDLHPVEETLELQENNELVSYRFVEESLEQRDIHDVSPAVFDVDASLLRTVHAVESVLAPTLVAPLSADVEVEVLSSLDRLNALLQEQIRVSRNPSGLLFVEGVVDGEQRRHELEQVLHGLITLPRCALPSQLLRTPSRSTNSQLAV
jgi:hypothetical protein